MDRVGRAELLRPAAGRGPAAVRGRDLTTRALAGWVGCIAVLAGILSLAVGVDVAYNGLESVVQRIAVPAFQVAMLVFAIGVVVTAAHGGAEESAVG